MIPPVVVDTYRFIYYPIPKVACTSLKQFCADLLGIEGNVHRIQLPTIGNSNYFKFIFVRNPWDRLVSCFLNKVKQSRRSPDSPGDKFIDGVWHEFVHRRYGFHKDMAFDEFILKVMRIQCARMEMHLKPQYLQFPDVTDLHVYHFETLEQDFAKICGIIGVDYKLKCMMVTVDRSHYRDYYSAKLRDLVAKKYVEDIARFGYKF